MSEAPGMPGITTSGGQRIAKREIRISRRRGPVGEIRRSAHRFTPERDWAVRRPPGAGCDIRALPLGDIRAPGWADWFREEGKTPVMIRDAAAPAGIESLHGGFYLAMLEAA